MNDHRDIKTAPQEGFREHHLLALGTPYATARVFGREDAQVGQTHDAEFREINARGLGHKAGTAKHVPEAVGYGCRRSISWRTPEALAVPSADRIKGYSLRSLGGIGETSSDFIAVPVP
jgi:hypothetical protein